MIILGIDPGIGRCGWGIIRVQNSEFKVQNYGCIETDSKQETPKRLMVVHTMVSRLIKKYKPDALAIEELFFGQNTKTAMVVGQARGVILLAAAQKNVSIAVYTPLQVKMALTGYGRAEKAQMGQMVKLLLKLEKIPKPDDTADALAVALTHAFTKKHSDKR